MRVTPETSPSCGATVVRGHRSAGPPPGETTSGPGSPVARALVAGPVAEGAPPPLPRPARSRPATAAPGPEDGQRHQGENDQQHDPRPERRDPPDQQAPPPDRAPDEQVDEQVTQPAPAAESHTAQGSMAAQGGVPGERPARVRHGNMRSHTSRCHAMYRAQAKARSTLGGVLLPRPRRRGRT